MKIPKIHSTRWTYYPAMQAKVKKLYVIHKGQQHAISVAIPEVMFRGADLNMAKLILKTKAHEARTLLANHLAQLGVK